MRPRVLKSVFLAALVCVLGVLTACITPEVKSAASAVDAARKAGKDKECPADFAAAESLVKQAEALCNSCKTAEANALAADAMAKTSALCPATPKPAPAPAPVRTPTPPPAAAGPTASLSAASSTIDAGACTSLNWSTSNASNVAVDQGVGTVDANGSKQVCPSSTTRYTLTATGPGGSRTDSTTVNVTAKAVPTDKLTIHVNFDTAKSDIRAADTADLKKADAFVSKY